MSIILFVKIENIFPKTKMWVFDEFYKELFIFNRFTNRNLESFFREMFWKISVVEFICVNSYLHI